MKTFTSVLALMLLLGAPSLSFAGNHPALTSQAGRHATIEDKARVATLGKTVIEYPAGVAADRSGNGTCPVMGHKITSKHHAVISLADGRHMDVCCGTCKKDVAADPAKYQGYIY